MLRLSVYQACRDGSLSLCGTCRGSFLLTRGRPGLTGGSCMVELRRPAMRRATERLDWLVVAGSKARCALAVIRIVNGAIALVAPSVIVKRFGEIPGESAAAIYGLRLFGVRTVLIGADLVTQRGPSLVHVTSQAVVIHASDTMT